MKKRTAVIGALLSLLPLGQPFFLAIGGILTSTGVMLAVPEKVKAESFIYYKNLRNKKKVKAESAIYYYNLGNKKFSLKDYSGAILDYTKAVEINPNFAQSYGGMCGAKINIGMNKEAVVDCNKALSLSNSNKLTNNDRAMIYANLCGANLNLGVHKDTIKDCTKALKFNPKNDLAFYNRGSAKIQLNDYYGAIYDLNKAIDLNLNSNFISWYYSNRGIAKENVGDLRGACADWREASTFGDQNSKQWVSNQC